jgi:hypothetical protein
MSNFGAKRNFSFLSLSSLIIIYDVKKEPHKKVGMNFFFFCCLAVARRMRNKKERKFAKNGKKERERRKNFDVVKL